MSNIETELFEKLKNYYQEFEKTNNTWAANQKNLNSIISAKDFSALYKSQKCMNLIYKIFHNNKYIVKAFLLGLFQEYPQLGYDIAKNSIVPELRIHAIQCGYYHDLNEIDALAESLEDFDSKLKLFIVSRCSLEVLKKLRKDPEDKVRIEAYKRLGVVEYLDEMLDDKSMKVRLLAAEVAPMFYPKFKEMAAKEISGPVFLEIAKKIDVKSIPYMLGNRNLNSNARFSGPIKKILDRRLALGNFDFKEEENENE